MPIEEYPDMLYGAAWMQSAVASHIAQEAQDTDPFHIVIDVGNPWVFLLIPIPLPIKTRTHGHRSRVFQGYGFIGYRSVGMGKVHR
jgi:hypothetical protein